MPRERGLFVDVIEPGDGEPPILLVQGEIDLGNADELLEAALSTDHDQLVIDLTYVPFMDSIGLRSLVVRVQRLERQGVRVAIASPCDQVGQLFRMTGVDRVLDIHATQEAGRRAVRAPKA